VVLSACQVYHLLNMRSIKQSIFKMGFWTGRNVNIAFVVSLLLMLFVIYTPGVNTIFAFEPLPFIDLVLSMGVSLLVIVVSEVYKLYGRGVVKRLT
jgi:P-type Ca2+ transporter type 2C